MGYIKMEQVSTEFTAYTNLTERCGKYYFLRLSKLSYILERS